MKTSPAFDLLRFLYTGLPGAKAPGCAAAYGYVLNRAASLLEKGHDTNENKEAAILCRSLSNELATWFDKLCELAAKAELATASNKREKRETLGGGS